MKTYIAPSLLASDFLHLKEEALRAELSGSDWLHMDVMDGVYVPNISFGFDVIRAVHSVTSLPLDVHMMTAQPQEYLHELKEAGATFVTIHNDFGPSAGELADILREIRAMGMRPSISVRPKIPAEDLLPLLPLVDMALVMTVEPGFGGQKFMPDMMAKVTYLRRWAEKEGHDLLIEVDGGINAPNARTAAQAGANAFVVGTASFRAPNMREAVTAIRRETESGI